MGCEKEFAGSRRFLYCKQTALLLTVKGDKSAVNSDLCIFTSVIYPRNFHEFAI